MLKELHLLDLHKKYNLDIKGVIQIGAYDGKEFPIYEKLNIANRIWIEANPSMLPLLKKNVGDDLVIWSLLDEISGKLLEFNICSHGQSSSVLEFGTHKIHHPTFSDYVDKLVMQTQTLDNVLIDKIISLDNYNFINIDVQGYELNIFKGALNTLKYIKYIYTEVNFEEVYKNCVQIDELTAFLSIHGFYKKEEFNTGLGWGNAFYVKQ